MTLISQGHNHRKYFTEDWDLAKSFERFFDGNFEYAPGGYYVTI